MFKNLKSNIGRLGLVCGIAIGLPVIAAACSNDSVVVDNSVEALARSYIEGLSALKVTDTSTNDQLKWTDLTPLPAALALSYANPEFSMRPFGSAQEAESSAEEFWSATLPKSVAAQNEARYLWVRLRSLNEANARTIVLAITDSSNIRSAKVQLRALADFNNFNLVKVKLSGQPLDAKISYDLPNDMAPYLSLTFKVLNSNYLPEAEFINYLRDNAIQINARALATLSVRVQLKASYTNRVLFYPQEAQPDVREFALAPSDNAVQTNNSIGNLFRAISGGSWMTGSSRSAVVWPSTRQVLNSDLNNAYAPVEYNGVDGFASSTEALNSQSSNWSTTLPSSFKDAASTLWVRVRPRTSGDTGQAQDLTSALRIADLPLAVTSLSDYYDFNLANVKIGGTLSDATFVTGLPAALEEYVKLEYRISESAWVEQAAFAQYLKLNQSSISNQNLSSLKVRMSARNQAVATLVAQEATPDFGALSL